MIWLPNGFSVFSFGYSDKKHYVLQHTGYQWLLPFFDIGATPRANALMVKEYRFREGEVRKITIRNNK